MRSVIPSGWGRPSWSRLLVPAVLWFGLLFPWQRTVAGDFAAPAIGLQFGYNRADLWGEDAARLDGRNALLAGIYMQWAESAHLGVRLGVTYTEKGAQHVYELQGPGGEAIAQGKMLLDLRYLEIPALLLLHFGGPSSRWGRNTFYTGPALGIPLWPRVTFEPARFSYEPEPHLRNELDWIVGIDATLLERSRVRAGFSLRYSIGLTSVANDDLDSEIPAPVARNQVLSVILSVALRMPHETAPTRRP